MKKAFKSFMDRMFSIKTDSTGNKNNGMEVAADVASTISDIDADGGDDAEDILKTIGLFSKSQIRYIEKNTPKAKQTAISSLLNSGALTDSQKMLIKKTESMTLEKLFERAKIDATEEARIAYGLFFENFLKTSAIFAKYVKLSKQQGPLKYRCDSCAFEFKSSDNNLTKCDVCNFIVFEMIVQP